MSVLLDPVTARKLAEFARRRRRLILLRGLCAGVVSLIGAMSIVALLDRFFLLEDGVRIALSVAGYTTVVAAVWWSCVRSLARVPSATELARLIEATQPGLREDVISAVELGRPGS